MVELPVMVSILGQLYEVSESTEDKDVNLKETSGYCDWTTHRIVLCKCEDYTVGNIDAYRDKVLRHEVIHAFLMESGLHEAATFDDEHFEQMVDWTAIQFYKMFAVFKELGI